MPSTFQASARVTQLVCSLSFFLIALDILIVNLALPSISKDLGGGATGQQWVVDSYTLSLAALLLFAGNLSDRIGAKRALLIGIALFGVTSIICALAPNIGLLVAARFVQGFAAALVLPASIALIRETFPDPARRAHALGVWAAGGAVAAAAGPLLGGFLTTLDWRLVFAINIPVCVFAIAISRRIATSPRRRVSFDWAGQVLAVLALGGLVYGLIEGGSIGFEAPQVIVTLGVAVLALAGFITVQARSADPMMPLTLFATRSLRIGVFGGFSFMAAWVGTIFIASLYLQQQLGLSPLLAGLAFLPCAAVSLAGNLASGPLTNRFGTRTPTFAGFVLLTLGLVCLMLVAPLGSPWLIAVVVVLVGAGGSITSPPLTGLVLASVREEQAGIAGAILNTFRQVGGALAIAVFGVLIAQPDAFVSGMQMSAAIAAVFGVLAALACLGIRPKVHAESQNA